VGEGCERLVSDLHGERRGEQLGVGQRTDGSIGYGNFASIGHESVRMFGGGGGRREKSVGGMSGEIGVRGGLGDGGGEVGGRNEIDIV
jgi:hypothetical protein